MDSNLLSAVYKPDKLTTELSIYIYDEIQPKQLIQIIYKTFNAIMCRYVLSLTKYVLI